MEEEEEDVEEGEVDQNFRLELMKVLQQQNALVGFQAFSVSWCKGITPLIILAKLDSIIDLLAWR